MKPLAILISVLVSVHCIAQDPYVFQKDDSVIIQTIKSRTALPKDGHDISLAIPTPDGKSFNVKLNKSLHTEPSTFTTKGKLLVLSDIEGEFTAFRDLMLKYKVIDSAYNWIFGNNNVVLVGDHFDRGEEVIPYLWMLYKLDAESRQAGGYVHVILGNHDIMNLSGDLRYVQPKYFDEAKAMGKNYLELFAKDTELGSWLRSKNIIEKINNRLFVHGGISPEVNAAGLTIESINEKCRPYYDQRQVPEEVRIFFGGNTSPFWYRGYFIAPLATNEDIDRTFKLFGVKQIVVGHTIVDHIHELFNGKILAVDVNHHEGNHEAILLPQ